MAGLFSVEIGVGKIAQTINTSDGMEVRRVVVERGEKKGHRSEAEKVIFPKKDYYLPNEKSARESKRLELEGLFARIKSLNNPSLDPGRLNEVPLTIGSVALPEVNVVSKWYATSIQDRFNLVHKFTSQEDRGVDKSAEFVAIINETTHALADLHRINIIHGGVDPSHVRIDRKGAHLISLDKCVIANNGNTVKINRTLDRNYAAPEQVAGMGASKRSDVYSFGATTLAMLFGRELSSQEIESFSKGEMKANLQDLGLLNALNVDGKILRDSKKWQGLIGILKNCVQKDPSRRFASMQDVQGIIHGLLLDMFPSRLEREIVFRAAPQVKAHFAGEIESVKRVQNLDANLNKKSDGKVPSRDQAGTKIGRSATTTTINRLDNNTLPVEFTEKGPNQGLPPVLWTKKPTS